VKSSRFREFAVGAPVNDEAKEVWAVQTHMVIVLFELFASLLG
jgi:hypothetical protein